MANIVSFKIQIEGSNEFKTVTFSADELGKALDAVRSNAKTLNGELVNIGSVSQILEGVSSAVSQLNSLMSGLTSSYAAQIEAETKLATAMRNTMDATDEEIDSIKQLTAEQQRLGIVGDEVQLAAAQELATYLSLSSSLKTIIPTLNDMIAQQLGLGASAESATQIATMLGKVMNGQTNALSRYGYEFSEAQEYILKFGDESERAAVLCQVVGESVGGMNEALAKTDVGRQQQLANTLGDIKEAMGRVVQGTQPYVTILSQVGLATTGILQLGNAIKTLVPAQTLANAGARLYSSGLRMLGISATSAAAGTTGLRLAVAALYATITMGVSVAITGLVTLFTRLGQKGRETAQAIDTAADAEQVFSDSSMKVRLELAEETIKLESLIKSKQDATKAVADLNSRYGEIFGSHKTAAEWYDVLTQKSAAYAKQVGYEAQAKVIASQKAAKELELVDKENRMRELAAKAADPKRYYGQEFVARNSQYRADAKEWQGLKTETEALKGEISVLQGTFDICTQSMAEAAQEIGAVVNYTTNASGVTKTLADDLGDYRKCVERAVQVNQTFGDSLQDSAVRLDAMRSGITSLINKYGAESSVIQDLINEYYDLLRAREQSLGTLDTGIQVPLSYKDGNTVVSAIPGTANKPIMESEYAQALRLYREIKDKILTADPSQVEVLQSQLATLRELYKIPEDNVQALSSSVDVFGSLADAVGGLTGILDDSAASWLRWGSNLLRTIGQALPQLSALFNANAKVAASGAAAALAGIPIAGPIMAVAAVGRILSSLISIPHLASGALAYGPTLALIGEYPGAANNPEVLAPLDKLQNLVAPDGSQSGRVEFFIDGYMLRGFLNKVERNYSRTNG